MLTCIGPFRYLDFISNFFFIFIAAFVWKAVKVPDRVISCLLVRATSIRVMSPLTLYLYLNPLYSTRGGSTTRAEPFIKNPIVVCLRKNPLYKWKIFTHLMLVLSVTNTHDSFFNINKSELIGIAPMEVRLWADFKTT